MSLDVTGKFDAPRTADSAAPLPDPRYPIGTLPRPAKDAEVDRDEVLAAIATLAELPEQLRNAVDGLDDYQIETPYRPGGWTVRQVVHHVADSHMNAFLRYKLALTEDWPTIKVYNEGAWAKLHDSAAPVVWSLDIVEALHARWVMLLQSLSDADWQRGFVHPERGRMTLDRNTLLYAWHSRHHVAHITHLRAARGW
jgi:hypothetical protein